ncbi:tetratricopeptide repeat protein [Millionella massiliensis]|uniref:tetratricopeptide repeat protein n=1 Tax=Millionella massiliensis TaxID=1871023 RepID=UPI0013566C9E|nr:tetratricopeptide repeat protein [Millionella massiliensis]
MRTIYNKYSQVNKLNRMVAWWRRVCRAWRGAARLDMGNQAERTEGALTPVVQPVPVRTYEKAASVRRGYGARMWCVAGILSASIAVLPANAEQANAASDTVAVATTDTSALLKAESPVDVAEGGKMILDSIWAQANAAYSNGNYRLAVDRYETLLQQGVHSSKLYYNLGNSWFKQGRMGKAILNYNRALLLDPTDEDTQYNLAMANARIVDKIDSVPEFFLKTWLRDLGLMFSSDTWAALGLFFLAVTFAAIILWLLAGTMGLRKLGFYGGIVSLVLCLGTTFYANFQRNRLLHNTEAIVMNLVAPVKSSPSAGSKDIFVLHEGTRVRMLEQLDGWTEIVLSDGNKGWITSNAIEAIVKTDDGGAR